MKREDYFFYIAIILNSSFVLIPRGFKFFPVVFFLLVSLILIRKRRFKFDSNYFLFSAVPFFILIFGLIHTSDIGYGLKKIETGLTLVAYPLIFAMIPRNYLRQKFNLVIKIAAITFCLSTILFSFFVLIYFACEYHLRYSINHFNTNIDSIINPVFQIHSIYLALHVGLGIIFLSYLFSKSINFKNKILYVLCGGVCLLLLVILNKRMSIISLVVLFLTLLLVYNQRIKIKKVFYIRTLLIFVGIILGIIFMPRFKDRNSFSEFSNIITSIGNPKTSIGKRYSIYQNTLNLIKNKPLFGYGTGDSNNILSREMESYQKLNTHNQYLSYLLSNGLLIGGFFLIQMLLILNIGLRKGSIILFCIALYFMFNFITENILEREAGVLVYAFFVNLLLRNNWNFKNE